MPFTKGSHHSEETKRKLSEMRKGKLLSEETKNKIGEAHRKNPVRHWLGKQMPEETKRKISKALKGRPFSEEHKKKIGKSQIGRHLSEETKRKISESEKGKINSEEARRKMSESRKGYRHSEETKRKMRAHRHSDETKRKMSLSATERIKNNNGIPFPGYSTKACEFFKSFDAAMKTKGHYAVYGGGEYKIKPLGYSVDYINFDLKLIMEWDEKDHYDENGNLIAKDKNRQQEIQKLFPDYEFERIKAVDGTMNFPNAYYRRIPIAS